jgi:hypothetical protein
MVIKMPRALLIVALAMLTLLSGAGGQNADSNEPNNQIGDATNLSVDQAISSNIFPAGDVDFYKVHVDSPGVFEAQLSDIPKTMKGRIDFYGTNMNWMTRKDAENPGDSVILELDIGKAGWYYVGIVDLSGGSNASEYSLTVSFEPVVDEEPNGEIGEATEIKSGDNITGYIFPAQDWDLYKVFLNSSGILQVSLTNVPQFVAGSMKGRIDFYGHNMNWITRTDAENAADNVVMKLDIVSPGWYYVGVGDLNGGSYNKTYNFAADFEPVIDPQELNNEIGDATEVQLGQETKGYIFSAGDVDFYKVNIDKPGPLQASLEDVPKSAKLSMKGRIDFYGKNMNWITRMDAQKPGDNVLLKVDIAEAGWYYFGISDLNGGSYDTEYTFKVE